MTEPALSFLPPPSLSSTPVPTIAKMSTTLSLEERKAALQLKREKAAEEEAAAAAEALEIQRLEDEAKERQRVKDAEEKRRAELAAELAKKATTSTDGKASEKADGNKARGRKRDASVELLEQPGPSGKKLRTTPPKEDDEDEEDDGEPEPELPKRPCARCKDEGLTCAPQVSKVSNFFCFSSRRTN